MESNQPLNDSVEICEKETENLHVSVKTQILDEPQYLVILIHKTVLDKSTGKSTTERIHREVIDKFI